ncbi:MAG TPA: hypothetical protein PLN21_03890 [Gemmatales bacterium]|nr:hypothetical protein [Gemmatales bacterium]
MSEAKPVPSGPERRWRKEQPSEFKSIERRGRMAILAIGAVVLAGILIGSLFMWGSAKQTHLDCYPYGRYDNELRAPAPWFFHDANQLYQTFGVLETRNPLTKLQHDFLISDLKSRKEETIIIYIAGRGIARNNKVYVLPSDATDVESSWISLASIIEAITESPSKHKLLLLDIAGTAPNLYTGPLQDSIANKIDDYLAKTSPPPFPMLTSCSRDETSNVMAVTGSSVFGHYLNQGLQGLANGFVDGHKDQEITVKELVKFVNTRVNRWTCLNLGRTQTPKCYGPEDIDFLVVHRHKIANWLEELPKPAETPAPPDESNLKDKEKQENNEKREKEQKAKDQEKLRFVFPKELEEGWKVYEVAKNTPEYALRLATLNRFAHHLRQYEGTVMLFNNSPETERTLNKRLLTDLSKHVTDVTSDLSKIELQTRLKQLPNSITALWPRSWLQLRTRAPREIPTELVDGFNNLYSSWPSTSAGSVKADPTEREKAFLDLVSGKKDEKNPAPSRYEEALFLCWDKLCAEDTRLTLDLLKRSVDLMTKLLPDAVRNKLHERCNELDMLRWIIEQSEGDSEWNFSGKEYETNRELGQYYFDMIHQWLMAEYLSERCANGYLPDGVGFASRQASLESVKKQHQRIVQQLLELRNRKSYRPLSSEMVEFAKQFKSLSGDYTNCLKDMDQERAALDAWWASVAVLQATAEMMVSEDNSERWQLWDTLANKTLLLKRLLKATSLDPSARTDVIKARDKLVNSFNDLKDNLLKSGNQEGVKWKSCRGIERVLKCGLLTTADRRKLHELLMKLQEEIHISTVNIEIRDDKGTEPPTKPEASPMNSALQADRRAVISRQLLLLGGSTRMEKANTTPSEEELRNAWTEEMPELLKVARGKENWLDAARIEAVLPQTNTTDALLQWRLKSSKTYYLWLEERQKQLEARQLHVPDQRK